MKKKTIDWDCSFAVDAKSEKGVWYIFQSTSRRDQ